MITPEERFREAWDRLLEAHLAVDVPMAYVPLERRRELLNGLQNILQLLLKNAVRMPNRGSSYRAGCTVQ